MDELESQEFTLEDIMKEFGGDNDEPLETEAAVSSDTIRMEPVEELLTMDTVRMEPVEEASIAETIRMEPVEEPLTTDTIRMEAVEETLSADTVRIDGIPGASVAGDTIRMDPVPSVTSDTIRMDTQALEELHAEPQEVTMAQPLTEPEEVEEPFTEQWEPEYEQPMGEYKPPQPIVFKPQSRLRELKRKLVAGPEKRYYELSEMGMGKLQLAIFVCLALTLLSVAVAVLYANNGVPQSRMRLMVFGQLFLMLMAALPGSFQLIEGIDDMLHKRFSLNSLLVITLVVCITDAVFCLQSLQVPCCAAFCLEMFMSLWSAYHKRSTEMGMMDTMRKATQLDKLAVAPDYLGEEKALLREQAQVEDFMGNYKSPSGPEKLLNKYALIGLLMSLAVGVFAGIMDRSAAGAVQVMAVSLLVSLPASAFITLTRPWAVLERQLHKLGAVICGWQGVTGLQGKLLFPVDHTDLFPAGAAKLNGVKFFGSREPDEIVAYCTALVKADGGSLSPLFEQVLESRNGHHYDVTNFQPYSGGIGGEVLGESVLVGMLPFLRDMGVEVPEGIRVNQAVCVAIDGELCGLFAVTYEKNKQAAMGLGALCSTRKLKAVLTNNDFMLTESFLRAKFGVNPKRMQIPDHGTCRQLQEKKLPEDAQALILSTRTGLAPFAVSALGAKALRTASILGVVIHMLGGILGLATMVVLTALGRTDLLTPVNMFLYQLVWLVPGLLVTQWTKIL